MQRLAMRLAGEVVVDCRLHDFVRRADLVLASVVERMHLDGIRLRVGDAAEQCVARDSELSGFAVGDALVDRVLQLLGRDCAQGTCVLNLKAMRLDLIGGGFGSTACGATGIDVGLADGTTRGAGERAAVCRKRRCSSTRFSRSKTRS